MIRMMVVGLLLMLCVSAFAQDKDQEKEGYGKAVWGMSEETTRATVDGDKFDSPGGFVVNTTAAGHPVMIYYGFTQNKLALVVVLFADEHVDNNWFLSDYSAVSLLLAEKYGEPVGKEWIWVNDLFKGDPQEYGTAIAAEQLLVYETWETTQTEIEHSISGKEFHVVHKIRYASREYEGLMEKEKKKQDLGGL
jgi:hypothetical protein